MKKMSRPAPIPPANKDDIHGTWRFLEWGVNQIMTNLKEGLDQPKYLSLYTSIHNFCTAQKASGTQALGATHRGAHLLGEELYRRLGDYLQRHLKEVHQEMGQHADESLITFYIEQWERYTTAARFNNNLFKYLNRHWVKREVEEGKKHVYDIYTLHLVRWKQDMFSDTQNTVMSAVLRQVEKQRNGDTIEQSKIKKVVDSFVALGIDETDSSKTNLDVYRRYFETPFVAATREYYRKESRTFLMSNTVVEYMAKAEARLDEEKQRVPLYLLHEMMQPLMRACEEVLITEHVELLRDEFQLLLDENREQDMARMYNLLSRIPSALEPLRQKFELHVRRAGLAAVERVASQAEKDIDPKIFIDSLLEVHRQYSGLVTRSFRGEDAFVRALDNACREYINRNKLCAKTSARTPEMLAKHADNLLKRSTKATEEDDMEQTQNDIMTIFKYIEDRDVFQKFYAKTLAKRLVNGTSASPDAETSMISKLKDASGFEYTNKLQRMFQDIQTSRDLNVCYDEYCTNMSNESGDVKGGLDTYFQVLGTGFWPLQPPTTTFLPPEQLVKTYERFQAFYASKHSGRKLTWLWHLCKGEIRANYAKTNKVPYTFQVSTYQMAILLLFNDSLTVSYDHMLEATDLQKETLDPSIAIMVKAKVIIPQPEGATPKSGTEYKLNTAFKSKKLKINLNMAIKSEQKVEVEETHKTIEEDRKMLIQSAIVRIMKSRKKMKHSELVSDAIGQIKSRFTPRVADIKKCIDILIEKEYLERLEDNELGYLA
ncbi:Cullin-domain-containing protein [Piedraia hortae CBS 480.64]|uniref:Cullin-1 n=1 Tax=Piedraia hortae CBS 480.64 TaxID=1314780 RepID=A0A6A7C174_9PEZI|nr:Cullin-domain-containing protein [Piedraia hortae CBS 480.64]